MKGVQNRLRKYNGVQWMNYTLIEFIYGINKVWKVYRFQQSADLIKILESLCISVYMTLYRFYIQQ